MATKKKPVSADPTQEIRVAASRYPGVDEGSACTQSAFRVGKRSFLFVGMQGGAYKVMFKLDASLEQAAALQEKNSDGYQVGKGGWVTARFTADAPMPKSVWKKWLDESYKLSAGPASTSAKKKASAPRKKRTSKK